VSGSKATRQQAQAGFTLIELMIATAIGLVVMTALTSVVFTTYQANQVATSRAEASGEIRNFQQAAYDDFALSSLPASPAGCGNSSQPCSQDPIKLQGCVFTNPAAPSIQSHAVSYAWNNSSHIIDRQVGARSVNPAASNVTGFAWYLDGTAPNQTVVVTITVTVGAMSQTQTMRFHPRVAPQLPAYVWSPC
jgi:prepilin-type N-terminal cleavage/methylation domain-containing protein